MTSLTSIVPKARLRQNVSISAFLVLLTVVTSMASAARAQVDEINANSVSSFFDAAMAVEQNATQLAGAVVSVVLDDQVIFARGYGFADLERNIPVDPAVTLFRLASVTKTFVWTAVMQQVEAGTIDLDADVGTYIDFRIPLTFAQPVTMRHLLAHTAGFEDQWTGYSGRRADEIPPLGTFLAAHIPVRVRPPGILSSYSNYGTALAGYIVERVSGVPWDRYIEEQILLPLGMTSTSARQPLPSQLESRRATGYTLTDGVLRPLPYWFDKIPPDGVMSATATDMATYMRMHLGLGRVDDKRILNEATALEMQSVLFQQDPGINPFLHGFYRTDRNAIESFGHSGDWNGFHSILTLYPRQTLGVFIAVNSDSGASARTRLMLSFMDRFFGRPTAGPETSMAVESLDDYAGEWTFVRRNQSTFEKLSLLAGTVWLSPADGNQLRMIMDGDASRWVPVETDRFQELYGERRLIFRRDSQGKVALAFFSTSPWTALEKLSGTNAPAVHWRLLFFVGFVAAGSLVWTTTLAVRLTRAQTSALTGGLAASALLSATILAILAGLDHTLSGNVEEFQFGAPPFFTVLQGLSWLAAILAVLVTAFAARMLVLHTGSGFARFGLALLSSAGLLFAWQLWFWNMLEV